LTQYFCVIFSFVAGYIRMLDKLDRKLLQVLSANGRASHHDLGEAIGLSSTAVGRRLRAHEDEGLIAGYAARIDRRKLGFGATVIVRIVLTEQSEIALNEFETAVCASPAIESCHLLAGLDDYLLVIPTAGLDDYDQLHRKVLSRLPRVARIESSFSIRCVVEQRLAPRCLAMPMPTVPAFSRT
jgi:DNA-binding Lrp family transcriptional regulator